MASPTYRNWTELETNLLGSIVEHLTAMDAVRFRAVCTAWASAAPPLNGGLYLPRTRQMPHLVLPLAADEVDGYCTLLSLPDSRSHRLGPLPDLRGKRRQFVGSQDGWLFVFDGDSSCSLLNPLTRSKIQLPSLTPAPIYFSKLGSVSKFVSAIKTSRKLEFKSKARKIVTTPNPTASSYAALSICHTQMIFFTRAGMDRWVALRVEGGDIEDAIFSQGRFLTVSSNGMVHQLLDPTSNPFPEFTVVSMGFKSERGRRYLVEDQPSGDLLQVCLQTDSSTGEMGKTVSETYDIHVWRMGEGIDIYINWVSLDSLADRSLFVGTSHSMCLSVWDFAGLEPNCVYFAPHHWDKNTEGVVGVYSLGDGSMEPCCPPLEQRPPRLPLWITPTICTGQ